MDLGRSALALVVVSVLLPACEGQIAPGSEAARGTAWTPQAGASSSEPSLPDPGVESPNGRTFPAPEFNLEGEPIYSRAIPLTNSQWARSIQSILRLDSEPSQANSFLRPVGGFTLFPNNERVLEVSNQLRQSYQDAAAEIAAEVTARPGGIAQIDAGGDAETFIRTLGRRAFRRPPSDDEVAAYQQLYEIGTGLSGDRDDFTKGAGIVVEAMIQSPNFLYRTELAPAGAPLTSYEVAAKLSFWLLGTTPSDALLDRAERGELSSPEGVARVAEEMMEDPAATETAVGIYAEMFKFSRYRDVIKSSPDFDPAVNAELDAVSRLFFRHIYEQDLGLKEILTSTEGFVGPQLASYYGVSPAPATPTLQELGDTRPGFFSQVPYLMLFGDDTRSDAIHRGLFLNYQVLCAKLPTPNFEIPQLTAPKPNQTDRQRIEGHTGFGTCGESCHGGYINPLGFAFENFDGLGRHRELDNGQPVDTSSAYPIGDSMVPFSGAPELMELLSESTEAHRCFVKNLMSFGLQRDIVSDDKAVLDQLTTISMSQGSSIKGIIRELAKSPAFLSRGEAP